MAKIPDDLGARSVPQSRGGSASYGGFQAPNVYAGSNIRATDLSGVGRGMQEFGAGLAETAADIQDKNDRFGLAAAKSALLQESIAAQNELADDPDFETAQKRYVERMNKARQNLTPRGVSSDALNMWNLEADDTIMRGGQSVYEGARTKRIDSERAWLDGQIIQNLKDVENAKNPEDASQKIAVTRGLIDGLVDKGSITRQEAGERIRTFGSAAAKLSIMKMPEMDRLDLLKNGATPISVRNNNPGNIRASDGEFKVFDTPEQGMAAMEKDLKAKVSGNSSAMKANFGENYSPTIENIIKTWAPSNENDTEAYIRHVSEKSGLLPSEPLKEEDVALIMPAMIEMEGGKTASGYFATGTLADYMAPGEVTKMYDAEKGAIISAAIDKDPAQALVDLNSGKYKDYYTGEEITKYKELAGTAMEKQAGLAERDRLAEYIIKNKSNNDLLLSGNMTLEDVSRIESAEGSSAFTKYARELLVKETPKVPVDQKLKSFDRLQNRLIEIKSRIGGLDKKGNLKSSSVRGTVQAMNDFRDFQSEVMEAAVSGDITNDEAQVFIGPLSKAVTQAISKDKGVGFFTKLAPGIQDPYAMAYESFNDTLKQKGRKDDLLAKKELIMRFTDYLGDYESSGETEKDELLIDNAINAATASFAKSEVPVLRTLTGTPNVAISNDGTKVPVTAAKSDIKPEAKISVPEGNVPSFTSDVEALSYAESTGYRGPVSVNGKKYSISE